MTTDSCVQRLLLRPGVWSALFVFLISGCGASVPPPERDVNNPTVYASYIKSRVVRVLDDVKKGNSPAKFSVDSLVDTLSKFEKSPVGDNEAIYRELLTLCQELGGMSDAAIKKAGAKIDKIIALAKTLPGEAIGF